MEGKRERLLWGNTVFSFKWKVGILWSLTNYKMLTPVWFFPSYTPPLFLLGLCELWMRTFIVGMRVPFMEVPDDWIFAKRKEQMLLSVCLDWGMHGVQVPVGTCTSMYTPVMSFWFVPKNADQWIVTP
jgi:hypothetical protein